MKQSSMKKVAIQQHFKSCFALFACIFLSACSTTSLTSFNTTELVAASEVSVFIETDCNDVSFGNDKLLDATTHIKQAVTDYGFSIVDKGQAEFKINLNCRIESDLNLGIIPNEISGMIMVSTLTFAPTYWPTDLWVDMDVYDLRAFDEEQLETFHTSFVSQEGVIWAPFILFKLAYEFGVPKYNFDKFYTGLRSSTFSLLSQAESKSIFE